MIIPGHMQLHCQWIRIQDHCVQVQKADHLIIIAMVIIFNVKICLGQLNSDVF